MQHYLYHDRRSQKEPQSLWYGSMEKRPHEEFEPVMMSDERVGSLAQKIVRHPQLACPPSQSKPAHR
jgi:hypothetical protein